MRAPHLLVMLLCISAVFAHTAVEPNGTDHDHPLEANASTMCTPSDPIDDTNVAISAALLVFGSLAVLVALVLRARRTNRSGRTLRVVLFVSGGLLLLLGIVWAALFLEINSQTITYGWPGNYHAHADFQVMINNQLVDFTNDYYFTYQGHERSRYVHLHDPDYVVHVHSEGVQWRYFWETLNVTMNSSCLDVKGTAICNATFVRNGVVVTDLLLQPIIEGDRTLFHFGEGDALEYFPMVVGNNSCLHTGTCPERGVVPGCTILPE